MDVDHYPDHVKRVDDLIASGEAGRKVAKEIAEDQKVSLSLRTYTYSTTTVMHLTTAVQLPYNIVHTCTYTQKCTLCM